MLVLFRKAHTAVTIHAAAHEAAMSPHNDRPEPTPGQIEAGNYKKGGPIYWKGLAIKIENPIGSVRRGTSANGTSWESTITGGHYGYLRGTEDADGEPVDCFVGPDPRSEVVFVIEQVNPATRRFDEHKVVLHAHNAAEARAIYRANYAPGWRGLGAMTALTLPQFREWLAHHDTSAPMAKNKHEPHLVFYNPGRLQLWLGKAVRERHAVEHPGSRGGRYWIDRSGMIRYGSQPQGRSVSSQTPDTPPNQQDTTRQHMSRAPAGMSFRDGQWRTATGEAVSESVRTRLRVLRVPPAWTDVHLSADPHADLQAIGTDAKGRRQYLYSAEHATAATAEKFARLKAFNAELPALRQRIERDLHDQAVSAPDKEAAAVLLLIDRTGLRIGSDAETGAAVRAFGASTLRAEHVTVQGTDIRLQFVGKKGVQIDRRVNDSTLAALLKSRMAHGGRLFHTSDDAVRRYLHARDGVFKVKDFRTWHGTRTALDAMADAPAPQNATQFRRARAAVAKQVASVLGNTPAVALSAYIDPAVWQTWRVSAGV